MTLALSAASSPPIHLHDDGSDYKAGACNIGPAEITRRRRFGHVATATTIGLFVLLVALHVPPIVRAIVALPAAVAIACYIEAYLKFCIRFGWLGLFNFGSYGTTHEVTDSSARSADRQRSLRLITLLLVLCATIGVVAVLLPV